MTVFLEKLRSKTSLLLACQYITSLPLDIASKLSQQQDCQPSQHIRYTRAQLRNAALYVAISQTREPYWPLHRCTLCCDMTAVVLHGTMLQHTAVSAVSCIWELKVGANTQYHVQQH